MEPIYRQSFTLDSGDVDCFCRLKTNTLLTMIQEVSGRHSDLLGLSWEALAQRDLFWAVVRHRVRYTRVPVEGETLALETWPGLPTRAAYPRSVVGFDEQGQEVFRAVTLWVLMSRSSRTMVLPDRSGVEVPGLVRRELELSAPASLAPAKATLHQERTVVYGDLDKNGHMNNGRYVDWGEDLLPSAFHREHPLQELVACYLTEAWEGQTLRLDYVLSDGPRLRMDIRREPRQEGEKPERVCAIAAAFGTC